jgi:MFS family permease
VIEVEPSPVRGLPRNVFVLGIVSFFADVASEMVYPLIPTFVTVTLGAPVAVLGVVEGIAEGTASALKVASGWISDRVRARKPLVMAGYAASALGKLGVALSYVWPVFLLARVVDRFGKGVRTSPRDALIADSTPPALYGRAFGYHRGLDTMGAVVGPLAGLGLLAALGEDDLRLLFGLAVIPGLLSVLALTKVRDRPAGADPPSERGSVRDAPAAFWLLLGTLTLFTAGNSSDAFLILRGKDLGLSLGMVVLAYALYNAVYGVLAGPLGSLSDVVGRRATLVAGLAVFATVYFAMAAAGADALVWPLFALYGVYMALTEGVSKAFVADLAPERSRGALLGLYHTSVGFATVLASAVAGVLWQEVSPSAPFLMGGAGAVAAAALLLALPLGRTAPSGLTSPRAGG